MYSTLSVRGVAGLCGSWTTEIHSLLCPKKDEELAPRSVNLKRVLEALWLNVLRKLGDLGDCWLLNLLRNLERWLGVSGTGDPGTSGTLGRRGLGEPSKLSDHDLDSELTNMAGYQGLSALLDFSTHPQHSVGEKQGQHQFMDHHGIIYQDFFCPQATIRYGFMKSQPGRDWTGSRNIQGCRAFNSSNRDSTGSQWFRSFNRSIGRKVICVTRVD